MHSQAGGNEHGDNDQEMHLPNATGLAVCKEGERAKVEHQFEPESGAAQVVVVKIPARQRALMCSERRRRLWCINLRPVVVVAVSVVVALATFACGPQQAATATDGTWVGTITTEGNVTTVVNESGSVWGGTATLVEEASIGVEVGEDPYMFGGISGIWATDERIYVVDSGIPAVRVYDHDGTFVRTLGGEGQGPDEYVAPEVLAADQAGRVLVLDYRSWSDQRIQRHRRTG